VSTKKDTPNDKKHDIVQLKNPKTDRYIKIDRTEGKILSHKASPGPYKDIPIGRKSK
jgi:hypothetical protein